MAGQLAHWGHVCGLLGVGEEREVLGDLPYEDLAIVGARCNDAVVEGVPIGIQHHSCVSAEERYNVGHLSLLVQREDRECATATRFPIDREVLGVHLNDRDRSSALGFDIAVQLIYKRLRGSYPKHSY